MSFEESLKELEESLSESGFNHVRQGGAMEDIPLAQISIDGAGLDDAGYFRSIVRIDYVHAQITDKPDLLAIEEELQGLIDAINVSAGFILQRVNGPVENPQGYLISTYEAMHCG